MAHLGNTIINGALRVIGGENVDTINGVTVGSSPKFTDASVSASSNHYTPATVSGQDKTASASGATAAWSIDVVKGVTLNTDGKGHVTGISVTSGKIPANPNTNTTYTFATGDANGQFKVTPSSGSAYNVSIKGLGSAAYTAVGTGVVEVGKESSRSTSTVGTWTAMVRSDQTGSPTCPTSAKWWNIINLNNWANSSTNWVSQLAVATQDDPSAGVWYRHNDSGGTDISSSTWKRLAEADANGYAKNALKVNGLTVQTAVPTGALFTDHTYNFYGIRFDSGNAGTQEHDANNITYNGHFYYTSNGPSTTLGAQSTDGSLYSQAYNDSWVSQIAQDYRNGNLFVRGKNNGTWTEWHKVVTNEGQIVLQGPIVTNNSASGSWNECARFNRAANGWGTLYLGSSAGSVAGSEDTAWLIGTPPTASYGRQLKIVHGTKTAEGETTAFYVSADGDHASLKVHGAFINGNLACTTGTGMGVHAEGLNTTAGSGSVVAAHAEGVSTKALGRSSHSEGEDTVANNSGWYNHAEGYKTTAYGSGSHAEGAFTSAVCDYALAIGHYNVASSSSGGYSNTLGTAFAIGNGTKASALSNAFSVLFTGVVKAASTITASTTADYAEFFEWSDENPNEEDRVGYFITFDVGDKIRIATPNDDYILGISSGEPFVLGNGDCDVWNGMYLRDKFRRTIYESAPEYEIIDGGKQIPKLDKDGKQVCSGTRPKLNPNYDPSQPYVSRMDRPEWCPVGMLGVLAVRDDGTCEVNGYATINNNGIATKATASSIHKYRVIKRNDIDVVEVVFR